MGKYCNQDGCTFTETGVCILNFVPEVCPKLFDPTEDSQYTQPPAKLDPNDYSVSLATPDLPTGLVLDKEQISKKMSRTHCHLIGILGAPNAGKTAAIVSFYLLLSRSVLKGFEFRDSDTLMALEGISSGARRWSSGDPIEELTEHTRMTDERQAGFIHFKLHDVEQNNQTEFVLPDIPGEWTDALIDANRFDRLDFLLSCGVIWIVVDGLVLRDRTKRNREIHRTEVLIKRIAENFNGAFSPRLILVITHADLGAVPEGISASICDKGSSLGLEISKIDIASFALKVGMKPGTGLSELISMTVGQPLSAEATTWPDADFPNEREMLRFRVSGESS